VVNVFWREFRRRKAEAHLLNGENRVCAARVDDLDAHNLRLLESTMKMIATSIAILCLAACTTEGPTASTRPDIAPDASSAAAKAPPPPGTTPTWKIPLADATLAFRSDRTNGDGTYSLYTNGVCDVGTAIIEGGSGDATLNMSKGKCIRKVNLVYPDGGSELVESFANLNDLETSAFTIPVGATIERRFVINPSVFNNNSRCDRLHFGQQGPNSTLGVGADSVLVERLDARTWHVYSKPADPDGTPHDIAMCEKTGELLQMPIDFTIAASSDQP